jgi:hypothetical protein
MLLITLEWNVDLQIFAAKSKERIIVVFLAYIY